MVSLIVFSQQIQVLLGPAFFGVCFSIVFRDLSNKFSSVHTSDQIMHPFANRLNSPLQHSPFELKT
uniref:Uncharacterized protein n=1 Tax=Anguilla anguilla TaxID=7936 RepID=A0A0E9VI29_ANGAN